MQHCYSSLFSYNSFFPNIYCSPWSWHSSSHGSWVVHSSFIYWRKWFKSSILKAHWIISPPQKKLCAFMERCSRNLLLSNTIPVGDTPVTLAFSHIFPWWEVPISQPLANFFMPMSLSPKSNRLTMN